MTPKSQLEIDANDFIADADGSLEILCYSCLLVIRASMAHVEDAELRGITLKLTHKMEREISSCRFHSGGPSLLHLKVIRAWLAKFVRPHRDDEYLLDRMRELYPDIAAIIEGRIA